MNKKAETTLLKELVYLVVGAIALIVIFAAGLKLYSIVTNQPDKQSVNNFERLTREIEAGIEESKTTFKSSGSEGSIGGELSLDQSSVIPETVLTREVPVSIDEKLGVVFYNPDEKSPCTKQKGRYPACMCLAYYADFQSTNKAYKCHTFEDGVEFEYFFSEIPVVNGKAMVRSNGIMGYIVKIYPGKRVSVLPKFSSLSDITGELMPDREKITNCCESSCCDSSCIVNIADKTFEKYGPSGLNLPYVLGGVTPYDISATLANSKDSASFFNGVGIWTSTPGFDCSGMVWWIFKHSGVQDFNIRMQARTYEKMAEQKGYQKVCGDTMITKCTKENIAKLGMPGDIIFCDPSDGNDQAGFVKGEAKHIAVYMGNGQLLESTLAEGTSLNGLRKRNIPDSYYYGGKYHTHAMYRPTSYCSIVSHDKTPSS